MAAAIDTEPHKPATPPAMANALWYTRAHTLELRAEQLPPLAPSEAMVETLYSALSRGTERLVYNGAVPESEWQRMRAPHQSGNFPFPVKYGYSTAGVVRDGPPELIGQSVFCLYPHQDRFHVDTGWLVPVPESIPAKRATLSANMETALNAIWDSGAAPADQIIVIGAGIVGLLVSYLASRIPGTTVTLVDVAENRESFALAMGARFALPANAPRDADIVFHTSASAAGLRTAMDCAGFEATIVEMSWYGSRPVETFLGESFHANRLRLISSQVGHVAPSHRARWTHRRRIEAAIGLLDAPDLDCLVADEIQFADAAAKLPRIFANDWPDLPPVIRYT